MPRNSKFTFQDAAVAVGNGTVLNLDKSRKYTLVLEVSGITTATLKVQDVFDQDVDSFRDNGTDITADGRSSYTIVGCDQVRVRVDAWTSGTIYVYGRLVELAS